MTFFSLYVIIAPKGVFPMYQITKENLHFFTYHNLHLIQQPISRIVLDFHGLNCTQMLNRDPEIAIEAAAKGILYLFPYYGPWNWMNKTSVRYIDDLVDVCFRELQLPEQTPVISAGGSMGGLSALIYTRYARRTPTACAANCPVCDLPFHYTERPDLPRTLQIAFRDDPDGIETAILRNSPLHEAGNMPDIPYLIIHGDADMAVNKENHSDKFVVAMRTANRDVTYVEVPGMEHCKLDDDLRKQYQQFLFTV